MHEYSLYGQVGGDIYQTTILQLAGLTRMRPKKVEEIRLVFKGKPPVGLDHLPSAGGSQGVQQQDLQRIKTMLNAALYYVHLVGRITQTSSVQTDDSEALNTQANGSTSASQASVKWTLEFKDTPDAGKQAVTSRMIINIPLQEGNFAEFLEYLGYEYHSRFTMSISEFYDHEDYITVALRQPLVLPDAKSVSEALDISALPDPSQLQPFIPDEGREMIVFINVTDGNNPDLKDRATKNLLKWKDIFKQAISLNPADRLSLDTKVPAAPRRL